MSLEEIIVLASCKALVKVLDKSLLIVVNPEGILGQQLRPRLILLINSIIIILIIQKNIYY
jgi:hypothetical protein